MAARVKICGVTKAEDALACLEMGADALGFNFYSKSPRHLDLESARTLCAKLPPFGLRVGVFVDSEFDEIMEAVKTVRLDTIQLHGGEPPEIAGDLMEAGIRVWKAIRVENLDSLTPFADYPCDALVLDAFDPKTPGGSGKSFDWSILSSWKAPRPWILSGGLTPDNVGEALENLSPCGVDVASGVESAPGHKDPELVKSFIQNAKRDLALV